MLTIYNTIVTRHSVLSVYRKRFKVTLRQLKSIGSLLPKCLAHSK